MDRKDYHVENSIFPIAFFFQNDNHYLIHETDWNRIDLYNLTQKKFLTDRSIEYEKQETYLDYFYGSLSVSPHLKWVLSIVGLGIR